MTEMDSKMNIYPVSFLGLLFSRGSISYDFTTTKKDSRWSQVSCKGRNIYNHFRRNFPCHDCLMLTLQGCCRCRSFQIASGAACVSRLLCYPVFLVFLPAPFSPLPCIIALVSSIYFTDHQRELHMHVWLTDWYVNDRLQGWPSMHMHARQVVLPGG